MRTEASSVFRDGIDAGAQTVTVSTLITEGLLPSTFANRQGAGGVAVGTSPFGQPYAIRAIRRPGSILTFVVFDSGTVMPGPITRTGYNTTTDSLTTLKGQVSSEISKHYQIPTGIIRQGETTVRGGFSGFTINVSAYVGASGVTQPTAIVLKGFPELESDGGDGGDEPTGGYSGTCNIVWGYYRVIAANTYQYYSPSCPSNAEEVDRFSACTTGVRVRNTPVGLALTIAPNHSETQTTRTCNYGGSSHTLTSTTNYESVYVNAAEISNNEAGGFVTHCGFIQENLQQIQPACHIYETGLPSVRDVAASAGQNAEAILCCIEE